MAAQHEAPPVLAELPMAPAGELWGCTTGSAWDRLTEGAARWFCARPLACTHACLSAFLALQPLPISLAHQPSVPFSLCRSAFTHQPCLSAGLGRLAFRAHQSLPISLSL